MIGNNAQFDRHGRVGCKQISSFYVPNEILVLIEMLVTVSQITTKLVVI